MNRTVNLERLQRCKVSVIVCCCFADDDPHTRIYESAGISYVCALLSDGDASQKAASVPAFIGLLERSFPLVRAALAKGDHVLVHCNSGMHRSASIAMGLVMAIRGEEGPEGLARVFAEVVNRRQVMRPTFWPLLESKEFTQVCSKLRSGP